MEKILLYYKYIDIENPELVAQWQKSLCGDLKLRGRIIIAPEGINGTVGGTIEALEHYKAQMDAHPLFAGIDFKESPGSAAHFPRLSVKVKKEIVSLGIDPAQLGASNGAAHLKPAEAHERIKAGSPDLVIFDVRNTYESRIGSFDGALNADISNFRELPAYIDKNSDLFKNKEVIMACTGGVRCERASAYLLAKGLARTVHQIKGGIHRYLEEFPEGFFRGKNFVFDGRLALSTDAETIIAQCESCNQPYDEYSHCVNTLCNKFLILCPSCQLTAEDTCSPQCRDVVKLDASKRRTAPFRLFCKAS